MNLTRWQWLRAVRHASAFAAVWECACGLALRELAWALLGAGFAAVAAGAHIWLSRLPETPAESQLEDGDYVPPPRSLIYARRAEGPDGMPALEMGCDCGVITVCVFDLGGRRLDKPHEVATTCDGCQSVRWMTIWPAEAGEAP